MKLVIAMLVVVFIAGGTTTVFGAQLNWDARTLETAFEPKFTFQKTITFDYGNGGLIAEELRGKQESIQFSSDSSSKNIQELIEKLNKNLANSESATRITDLRLNYSAQLTGYQSYASIEYNIILIPTIEQFIIQEYSEKRPAILDVSWRGLTIPDPIILSDQEYDITKPLSLLKKKFPIVYRELLGTDVELLLSKNILDTSKLKSLEIAKWHSLFDPTSIVLDATKYGFKGGVVTTFSMGTSDIFNPTREKIDELVFNTDREYKVSTFEASDSGNLLIPGYASSGFFDKSEVIQTGPKPPVGMRPISDKEQFPIFVIYGMTGIAAIAAGGFFWWSNKKAKKETFIGQTGIDPAKLRSIETSSSSDGYKTNRGEAHLIENSEHYKIENVFDDKHLQRTMPKGWKYQ